MKPKFTPGPWRFDSCNVFGQPCFQISQEDGAEYTPNFPDVANTERGEDPEVWKANAALISAAPELYDCLLRLLELRQISRHAWDEVSPEGGSLGEDVEAALKKARGEK